MKRRTNEEARRALLDAATAQLEEQLAAPDPSASTAFLDLHAISAAAGYRGTSMIYSLWEQPDTEEPAGMTAKDRFAADVIADSAVAGGQNEAFADRMTASMEANGSDAVGMVQSFANAEFSVYSSGGEREMSQTMHLWALTMINHSAAKRGLINQRGSERIRILAEGYIVGLEVLGRRLLPEFSPTEFAVLMRSLLNGILIEEDLETFDPSKRYDWHGRPDWTLFSVGVYSMMLGLTEPIEPAADSNAV